MKRFRALTGAARGPPRPAATPSASITRGMTSNGHARSMPLPVGVHRERDAHRQDVEVGPDLALLQLGQAQLGERATRDAAAGRAEPSASSNSSHRPVSMRRPPVGPGRRGRHARWLVLLDVMRVRTL